MILFLLTNLILFIKLFLFILLKIILIKNTFSKICVIIILVIVLKILNKYPRTRFKKLSQLRKYRLNLIHKFRISGLLDEIYNIIMLLIYFIGITTVIFYFRLLNKERIVDLKYYFFIIKSFVTQHNFINISCTFLIYVLLVILYIILMLRVIKYFKFHVIKRHIYFMNFEQNSWYQLTFFFKFLHKFGLFSAHGLEQQIYTGIVSIYKFILYLFKIKKDYGPDYDKLPFKEQVEISMKDPVDPDSLLIKYNIFYKMIPIILKYTHYIFLIILIMNDIIFNNFIITKIFNVFPWIFFYDLYVRVSIFIDDLHLPYDQSFHNFVYANSLEVLDKNNIIIDGEIRDYHYFKHLYHTYVKKNFVKDRKDLYN